MSQDGQRAAASQPRSAGHDPAFRAAIEAGFLTPRQALQRGRRDAYAANLATKHGLTLQLALDVADNRIRLGQAIRRQRSPAAGAKEQRAQRRSIGVAVLALGVPLVLFLAAFVWNLGMTPSSMGAGLPASARVSTDPSGRVTRVTANDPYSVLQAYCVAARTDRTCLPAGLLPPVDSAPRLRVGILGDPASAEPLLALPIRQEVETGQWWAGNGNSPLVALLAPDEAAASLERPGPSHSGFSPGP